MTKTKWKKIGVCGVDSGQLLLTDSCYVDKFKSNRFMKQGKETKEYSYDGCCQATMTKKKAGELKFKNGISGAGVCFSTGYGDGIYPVYAKYNKEGRIIAIHVLFVEEE
jgi:hypothetical protein